MPIAAAPLRTASHFSDIRADTPNVQDLERRYARFHERMDVAATTADWLDVVRAWDDERRLYQTWEALVELHFDQDTTNATYRDDSKALNALRPTVHELDAAIKRRLLQSPARADLVEELGRYAFDRWACEVTAVDPRNAAAAIAEATLGDDYTAIAASARIPFDGRTYGLSDIAAFAEDGSRERREASTRAKWAFYDEQGAAIDTIFDRLVETRTAMAHTLGCDTFIDLGTVECCAPTTVRPRWLRIAPRSSAMSSHYANALPGGRRKR